MGVIHKPMAQVLNLIDARVEFPANKVWQSDKGGSDYVSLKCKTLTGTSPNGKDPVVYANVGSPEQSILASFKKGDPVQLTYDGKKYSLVGSASTLTTANNTTPPPAPEPAKTFTKAEIKERALKYAELYREIYTDLVLAMPPEQAQLGATAVFNQLSRLFS